MSVQRWTTTLSEARYRMDDGPFVLYADHARIVGEMEQAHAAAWDRCHGRPHAYDAGYADGLAAEREAHSSALAEAVSVIEGLADQQAMYDGWYVEPLERLRAAAAAAPRTLTSDCLHLAEMYVGQSSRDNEYGRRSSVIECLACGALRLDDETVPPNRLAGGDFDTSGQPRTLTADDPEPSVGSVAMDRIGVPWLARIGFGGMPVWASAGDTRSASWGRMHELFGPVTLIHDGEATP